MRNRWWKILAVSAWISGCGANSAPVSDAEGTPVQANPVVAPVISIEDPPRWVFPQRRLIEGGQLIYHAPQIRDWPKFETTVAQLAFEYIPDADTVPKLGTITFTGTTDVNIDERIVHVRSLNVSEVRFSEAVPDEYTDTIMNVGTREHLEAPLDLFLTYLAADAPAQPTPEGFSTQPPPIHFVSSPTILLFVNGEPVLAPLDTSGVSVVANANWPTFKTTADASFYLLNRDVWLTAPELAGPWSAATVLPDQFQQIPETELQDAIRSAIPLVAADEPVPDVIFTPQPAELIVTVGEPELVAIPETDGLQYVTNTESPLFVLGDDWYYLVSGRWFSTQDPAAGDWTFAEQLPTAFQMIPVDHELAAVRASVPGTNEASLAALEALLPVKTEASLDAVAPEVSYAGEPEFVAISGTEVSRATNTSYDIIEHQGRYYLCYSGIWYAASSPAGPWIVTADIPTAIYAIPPSSPSYPVTHVTVYETTPTTIVYTYPPAYSSSVYVVYGVPVYGTGWYYPPYIYGAAYYPYYASYGHGSYYNPNTGGYGSRSVAYGPYGGYSYTQGYNPSSGRYGYVETAWDNDEWASYGETYNPRTGIGTETSRYYDEDKERMETEREVNRGNQSVELDRTVDFDEGVAETRRETSAGGSSNIRREFDDETMTSRGTVTAADGRTATISGQHTIDVGTTTITGSEGGSATIERDRNGADVTRESSFYRDGQTVTTETQRQGRTARTEIESSGGGQATSVSSGLGRTTVGESASGDLYAGHDGNVYKKTDSGWSKYDANGWEQMATPERFNAERSTESRTAAAETARSGQGQTPAQPRDFSSDLQAQRNNAANKQRFASSSQSRSSMSRGSMSRSSGATNYSSLNRDYNARQGGYDRFSQRRSGSRSRLRSGASRGGRRRR